MTLTLGVAAAGLVTPVGLSMPASAAAIRAGLTNPTETRFRNCSGDWIMAHAVPLEEPWRGRSRLVKMASRAVRECISGRPEVDWRSVPVLLCVAERDRPGRQVGLDEQLFAEIQAELNLHFSEKSVVIPLGRTSVATALTHAARMIEAGAPMALIVATDSLISWPTLKAYDLAGRLLSASNSDGFIPGEGAGALLVKSAADRSCALACTGIGLAREPAHIESGEPLRGNGLTEAIKGALGSAGCELHQLHFRIADVSGEQYYFKEAALAIGRVLRVHKEKMQLWHPAECIGETGALSGITSLAVALMAGRKGYAPGPGILLHSSADDGTRAAIVAVTAVG